MQPPIQPNPYAPPLAPIAFTHEPPRYEFAAEVLESDVHRVTTTIGAFFCRLLHTKHGNFLVHAHDSSQPSPFQSPCSYLLHCVSGVPVSSPYPNCSG